MAPSFLSPFLPLLLSSSLISFLPHTRGGEYSVLYTGFYRYLLRYNYQQFHSIHIQDSTLNSLFLNLLQVHPNLPIFSLNFPSSTSQPFHFLTELSPKYTPTFPFFTIEPSWLPSIFLHQATFHLSPTGYLPPLSKRLPSTPPLSTYLPHLYVTTSLLSNCLPAPLLSQAIPSTSSQKPNVFHCWTFHSFSTIPSALYMYVHM